MKIKHLFLIGTAVLLTACSNNSNSKIDYVADVVVEEAKQIFSEDNVIEHEGLIPSPDPNTINQPKIIKNGYLEIEVENYNEAKIAIDSIIKTHNAYTQRENYNHDSYRISNNINIKVSSQSFDHLLSNLAKVGKKVNNQNVETTDVTAEFIDIETQLANKRKVERTLIKLLNKATSIEDILKIEAELGKIRTEIETAQGRMKYLNNRVSLSDINVYMYQNVPHSAVEKTPFWKKSKKALVDGWHGIVDFVVFLIRIWPVLIIVAIIIVLIHKHNRKKRIAYQNIYNSNSISNIRPEGGRKNKNKKKKKTAIKPSEQDEDKEVDFQY